MYTSYYIASPLEQFEVTPLLLKLSSPILGQFHLAVTNLGFYAFITVFLVLGVHIVTNNGYGLVPSRWSVRLESTYASVQAMVREQIGPMREAYMPFIYSIFVFLVVANLNGNVPYGFTIRTSVVVSIGLSVTIFLGVTLLGLSLHGVHFFSYFIPAGTPLGLVPLLVLIELVSYTARARSLGVRLFANMTAGHTLLKILSTFLSQLFTASLLVGLFTLIPFRVFVALVGLELAVSLIQAYVFCVLTCSYIKDAIELH